MNKEEQKEEIESFYPKIKFFGKYDGKYFRKFRYYRVKNYMRLLLTIVFQATYRDSDTIRFNRMPIYYNFLQNVKVNILKQYQTHTS